MLEYFLPVILVLGLITSFEDIKLRKIKNRWIFAAIIYALIINFIFLISGVMNDSINLIYFGKVLSNFCFGIFIGFLGWENNIWSPGDGKLFIAFSILMPISLYKNNNVPWIESSSILFNTAFFVILFFLILILIKIKSNTFKKYSKRIVKDIFNFKEIITKIIRLFVILISFNVLFNVDLYFKSIIIAAIFFTLENKRYEKEIYFTSIFGAIIIVFFQPPISLLFITNIIKIIIIWQIIKAFFLSGIKNIAKDYFSFEMNVKNLKKGMNLTQNIIEKDNISAEEEDRLRHKKGYQVFKKDDKYYIIKPKDNFKENSFIKEGKNGLTDEEIKKIQDLGIKDVKIYQHTPFAVFLFIGVLLTIIFKENLFIYISNFLF
ncbi:MAG: hypothetical protein ACQER9_03055 [Nanobdellota archaeon]